MESALRKQPGVLDAAVNLLTGVVEVSCQAHTPAADAGSLAAACIHAQPCRARAGPHCSPALPTLPFLAHALLAYPHPYGCAGAV